jgi:hypothetical protein
VLPAKTRAAAYLTTAVVRFGTCSNIPKESRSGRFELLKSSPSVKERFSLVRIRLFAFLAVQAYHVVIGKAAGR